MGILRFLSPVLRWGVCPLSPIAISGYFEIQAKTPLDVAMWDNGWAVAWALGVFAGYLIWDASHWRNSQIRLALQGFFSPLSFKIEKMNREVNLDGNEYDFAVIGARISNLSRRKKKQVCLVARGLYGCSATPLADLEFCVDVPARSDGSPFMMIHIRVEKETKQAQFMIDQANLKSQGMSIEWCDMINGRLEFEPCFNSDTQEQICLRRCTIVAPLTENTPIGLIEEYYAEK